MAFSDALQHIGNDSECRGKQEIFSLAISAVSQHISPTELQALDTADRTRKVFSLKRRSNCSPLESKAVTADFTQNLT